MADRPEPTNGDMYLAAHRSFDEFARTLTEADWATTLACTPRWTARDILSHVAGIPDDAAAGRMDGAPGEAWTRSQVERNASLRVDALLDRWASQAPEFASILDAVGEVRPPLDCHSHEHDIRHGIGRPGSRDSVIVEVAPALLTGSFDLEFAVVVELTDGRTITSAGSGGPDREPVTLRGVDGFEVFRSRLGRRSLEQVRAYEWTGAAADVDTVVGNWFAFGPSLVAINES